MAKILNLLHFLRVEDFSVSHWDFCLDVCKLILSSWSILFYEPRIFEYSDSVKIEPFFSLRSFSWTESSHSHLVILQAFSVTAIAIYSKQPKKGNALKLQILKEKVLLFFFLHTSRLVVVITGFIHQTLGINWVQQHMQRNRLWLSFFIIIDVQLETLL